MMSIDAFQTLQIFAALLTPCVERDEFVGSVIADEELFCGSDGWASICVPAAMASVVEDDIAGVAAALVAVDFPDQVFCDLVGGGFAPVHGHGVPCDGDEAELAGELDYVGAARAEGRSEVAHRFAGDVGENVAGAG